MQAAIYLRVSSDEQAEHGHSIAFQRNDCHQRAKELGATTMEEFADEGVSGAVLERPALEALRKALRAGGIDVVVVWDPDRLSRRLAHQLILTEEIERHSKLVFVKFEWQDTPEGQLFYQLRGAVAQYEREKIRERTVAGRRQKARGGRLPFAMEPYGYRYNAEQATLVIAANEAAVVRRIFADYVSLKAGLNGIAHALTLEQVPTRKGGVWHRQVVRQIIRNPVYKGHYYANRRDMTGVGLNKYRQSGKVWASQRPPEEWIPVAVPGIVAPETWDEAQQLMERARRLWHSELSSYLLSGLVTCDRCGLSMTGVKRNHWGKKVPNYTCRKPTAGAKHPGCSRFIRAEPLENQVWSQVTEWVEDPDALLAELDPGVDQQAVAAELARVETNLRQVQAGQRRILLVLERGLTDADAALDSLNRLKQRERMLWDQQQTLQEHLANDPRSRQVRDTLAVTARLYLKRLHSGVDFETRRQLLRQYVVGITVGEQLVTVRARLPRPPARGGHEQRNPHAPTFSETHPGGGFAVRSDRRGP